MERAIRGYRLPEAPRRSDDLWCASPRPSLTRPFDSGQGFAHYNGLRLVLVHADIEPSLISASSTRLG